MDANASVLIEAYPHLDYETAYHYLEYSNPKKCIKRAFELIKEDTERARVRAEGKYWTEVWKTKNRSTLKTAERATSKLQAKYRGRSIRKWHQQSVDKPSQHILGKGYTETHPEVFQSSLLCKFINAGGKS